MDIEKDDFDSSMNSGDMAADSVITGNTGNIKLNRPAEFHPEPNSAVRSGQK